MQMKSVREVDFLSHKGTIVTITRGYEDIYGPMDSEMNRVVVYRPSNEPHKIITPAFTRKVGEQAPNGNTITAIYIDH